jgi:hypothetical protein
MAEEGRGRADMLGIFDRERCGRSVAEKMRVDGWRLPAASRVSLISPPFSGSRPVLRLAAGGVQ